MVQDRRSESIAAATLYQAKLYADTAEIFSVESNGTIESVSPRCANQDTFLHLLQENIGSALGCNSEDAIAAINKKLMELQKELLQLANHKKVYEQIADEINRL